MSGKFLGKRINVEDSLDTAGSKKSRYDPDAAQVVPDFESATVPKQDVNIPKEIKYGTLVERHIAKRAGVYVLGHEIGHNAAVPVNQFLARKFGTEKYYVLKILTFDKNTNTAENKEVLQGKTLLHTEYSLLTLLADLPGVIHHHGLFSDFAMEEKVVEKPDHTKMSIYTGKVKRRIILVLDCLVAHEFDAKSSAYVNLQKHISNNKFTELEAMSVFYEIVTVVEKLHSRNIIHRDLKLNNFVLNVRTKKVTITNFFLGKHLNREDDNLYDQRGSPAYISPDVLGGKPYKGKPSDMWALGVVLYTMIFGKFPFVDTTPTALFKKIRQADYVIPTDIRVCEVTVRLIRSMLTLTPQDRLTATEVRIEVQDIIKKMRGPKIEFDQVVPVSLEDDPYGLAVPKPPVFVYKCPRYDPSNDLISNTLRTIPQKAVNESFLKPRVLSIQRVGSDLRPIASLARNALINNNVLSWNLGRNRNIARRNSQLAPQNQHSELFDVRIAGNAENSTNRSTPPTSESSSDTRQQQILLRVNPQSIHHIIQNNAMNTVQNPAIHGLYSSLNEMFARGQIRTPDPDSDREFEGIVTDEMANRLVAWLLMHFRSNEIVREIFGSTNGNRVNNILELLRRFNVQMETISGQIQIKKEQTLDLLLFLTYLLQIAGYKNNYFLNIQ